MCERILDAALDALRESPDGSKGLTEEGRKTLRHELAEARRGGFFGEAKDTLERLAAVFDAKLDPRAASELREAAREAAIQARLEDIRPSNDEYAVTRRPLPPAPRLRTRAPSSPAHRFLRGARPGLVIVRC